MAAGPAAVYTDLQLSWSAVCFRLPFDLTWISVQLMCFDPSSARLVANERDHIQLRCPQGKFTLPIGKCGQWHNHQMWFLDLLFLPVDNAHT